MKPAEYNPFPPEVHDYVDGRMTSEQERDFERRMGANAELKKQVVSLRKALEMLRNMPVKQPPEGFDEKVVGRIREEELAERARKQIAMAPTPWWKHAVQVGVGAAAASVVFTMIGGFGWFGNAPGSGTEDDGQELIAAGAQPTEHDLLPALADHKARFDSLRRNVAFTRVEDPRAQRRLIAMELEYSELARRNRWLTEQVSTLPTGDRVKYLGFVETLGKALKAVDAELTRSRADNSAVNLERVVSALDRVDLPVGSIDRVTVSGSAHELFREDGTPVGGAEGMDEIAAYALVRQADYRHDHEAVVRAADVYLRLFGRGRFVDQANASAIAALIRLGETHKAAQRFETAFGEYDEDVSSDRHELVRGLLNEPEHARLSAARKQLRDPHND